MRWTEEKLAEHQAKRGVDTFQALVVSKGFNPAEDVDHLAVARYLDTLGIYYVHVPNEGKRKPRTGAKLKAMGMKKGISDFLIFDAPPLHPHAKGVALELKRRKGGKLSDDQREVLAELGVRGWICNVCEGANESLDWLRSLGWKISN